MGTEKMNNDDSLCRITFKNFALKTAPHIRKCRYHRIQGQEFSGDDFLPRGFCPHALRIAYPYCLSLLCDATYPTGHELNQTPSLQVTCPSCQNRVDLTITIQYTLPSMVRKLKRAAIRTLQFMGIDGEFPDKRIILEVSRVTNRCPRGLKEGQSFLFNIWNRRELCPASFYAVYPILMQQMAIPQEGTQGGEGLVHCPDPFGVYYRYGAAGRGWDCRDYFSRKAEVVGGAGRCPLGHKRGDSFRIEGVLPSEFCPLAFYSIFPYYLTLIHSGRFEWVRRGEHVKVQCPKVAGVEMEIELVRRVGLEGGVVRVRVINSNEACPKGYTRGDTFEFDSQNQPFCLHAIAGLIPFTTNGMSERTYTCFCPKGSLVFKVE
jgi:uncharacterized repeat protein (TIGR04076 family)